MSDSLLFSFSLAFFYKLFFFVCEGLEEFFLFLNWGRVLYVEIGACFIMIFLCLFFFRCMINYRCVKGACKVMMQMMSW